MITVSPKIKPKNKHLQSFLASSKIRLLRLRNNNPLANNSEEVIIKTKDAQLQGFISKKKEAKKIYILLSGWEGSSNSTYIQLLAKELYTKTDSSIFRLNFRDHGNTHHLNKELFHSCRLEEVVDAVKQISELYSCENVYLCGFSLGANFALRVAAKAYSLKINLTKVFAISPPLVPKNSMKAIEESRIYAKYFLKKWHKSLEKKHKEFPETFDDDKFKKIKSLQELTEKMIIAHSEYKTTDEYFKAYEITNEVINNIKVPCEVITSQDDPVIPYKDFKILENKKNIKLITTKHGGHCGFINNWKMHSWVEQYIIENSQL